MDGTQPLRPPSAQMRVTLAWIAACLVAACSSNSPSEPTLDAGASLDAEPLEPDVGPRVVYHRDVAPIIDAKCVGCHHPTGIGPVDFTDPSIVLAYAAHIGLKIESGEMPPWPPDPNCRTYLHDRSLTPEQRATILDWIDLGAPLGDPADTGAPIPRDLGGLTRVDRELPIPEAYTPAAGDDYHCFVIEWPATELQYITGFNIVPTRPELVHHVNIYSVDAMSADRLRMRDQRDPSPGYACFGGAATEGGVALLGAWAPGSLGIEYPAGTGLGIDPGSIIVLEAHYHAQPGEIQPDQLRLDLQLEMNVDRRAYIVAFWDYENWSRNRLMTIPANEPDVMHSFELDPNGLIRIIAPWITSNDLWIHGAGLHMHYLGKSAKIIIRRGGGRMDDCLIDIPRWDFHWQSGYLLREPIEFIVGLDRGYLECHWDNTAENQPFIGGQQRPPADVNWGGTSADEMCIGYAYVTQQ